MDIYIRIAVYISTLIITSLIVIRVKKNIMLSKNINSDGKNVSVLKYPKVILYVGIGGLVIFVPLTLYAFFTNQMIGGTVLLLFDLMYILPILLFVFWKVVLHEESFEYKTLFRTDCILYKDAICVMSKGALIVKYEDSRKFNVSYSIENWGLLQNYIEKYKKMQ